MVKKLLVICLLAFFSSCEEETVVDNNKYCWECQYNWTISAVNTVTKEKICDKTTEEIKITEKENTAIGTLGVGFSKDDQVITTCTKSQ